MLSACPKAAAKNDNESNCDKNSADDATTNSSIQPQRQMPLLSIDENVVC